LTSWNKRRFHNCSFAKRRTFSGYSYNRQPKQQAEWWFTIYKQERTRHFRGTRQDLVGITYAFVQNARFFDLTFYTFLVSVSLQSFMHVQIKWWAADGMWLDDGWCVWMTFVSFDIPDDNFEIIQRGHLEIFYIVNKVAIGL
jgi:hypothetical protein